jgi:hypothetical protein
VAFSAVVRYYFVVECGYGRSQAKTANVPNSELEFLYVQLITFVGRLRLQGSDYRPIALGTPYISTADRILGTGRNQESERHFPTSLISRNFHAGAFSTAFSPFLSPSISGSAMPRKICAIYM